MDKRTTSMDKRTSTRDVDRVSSGSVESDHIRIVYFKDKEATPSNAHRFLHYVHYNGKEEDEDYEEDDDPEGERFVSFEDMLEQAKAQSDRYSDVEDSEDEDFEPYVIHCEDYVEYMDNVPLPVALNAPELCALTVRDCPTLQASCIGQPRDDTGPSCASSQRADTDPSNSGPGAGISVAGKTRDAEAGMDSQLLRINNEDGTVAHPIHGKAPKGEGNPGAERGAAVKWS